MVVSNLSLPKSVAAFGGLQIWNQQDDLVQSSRAIGAACRATSVESALTEVSAIIETGDKLQAYLYMRELLDRDHNLGYAALLAEPAKLLPIVYTPTVGEACQKFGTMPLRRRGLYLSIQDRGNFAAVLREYADRELEKDASGNPICDCIVFSDGGRILGLGDLGVWGMGIPMGKLDLYTVCGGFDPKRTIPMMLDAGCGDPDKNTAKLNIRDHSLYTGGKHDRKTEQSEAGTEVNSAYYGDGNVIEEFMQAATSLFGNNCLLQFEDFNSNDAFPLLAEYRDKYLCYNDDIQGTAAIAVAGILGGLKLQYPDCKDLVAKLREQRYLFHGAGSANLGAINLLAKAAGVSSTQMFITNSRGLIWRDAAKGTGNFRNSEQAEYGFDGEPPFAHGRNDLAAIITELKPTCLVGAVGVAPGCFDFSVVQAMVNSNEQRPIIFAMSNPKSQAEITAEDCIKWSKGRAIYGSGTQFDAVEYDPSADFPISSMSAEETALMDDILKQEVRAAEPTEQKQVHHPGQVNNVYIFPGVSYGAWMCGASTIPDSLFLVAAEAVANSLTDEDIRVNRVVPSRDRLRDVSLNVATAVVTEAQRRKIASKFLGHTEQQVKLKLAAKMWTPSLPQDHLIISVPEEGVTANRSWLAPTRFRAPTQLLNQQTEKSDKRKITTKKKARTDKLTWFLHWLQILCTVYAALVLLPKGKSSPGGTVWDVASMSEVMLCPRDTICSEGLTQIVLIAGARLTAYFMYPALGAVFLTKCHALNTALSNSLLQIFMPLSDLHHIHARLGNTIALMVFLHTVFHVIRWAVRGELYDMLIKNPTGLGGLVAVVCCVPICLLMGGPQWIKDRCTWEVRKTAHYLCIPFAVAMLWHTQRLRIFMGVILAVYGGNKLYTNYIITYRITKPLFRRLPSGVQLTFAHPPGWKKDQIGYINIMVPWLSTAQWHPFSVYDHPSLPGQSSICIAAAGNWTKELHASIERPTSRPVWIQGPFTSPYEGAIDFDNLLLVASGIGITPALACLRNHKDQRRICLLWMCRDPALLEYFLDIVEFDDDGFTLIYYTGKSPLNIPKGLASNIRILPGRPEIRTVLAQQIQSVEEGLPLPHEIVDKSIDFTVKSVVNATRANSTDTALCRVKVVLTQLIEAGMTSHDIIELFEMTGTSDTARDGVISKDELYQGLVKLNVQLTSSELDSVVSEFDIDGDGTISVTEWSTFLEHHCVEHDNMESVRARALAKWDEIEVDGKLQALQALCTQAAAGTAALMNLWDKNGDRLLSEEEVRLGTRLNQSNVDDEFVNIIVDVFMDGKEHIGQASFSDGLFALMQRNDMSNSK